MKELEKKLRELQSQGFEQINISQILGWMRDIKWERAVRRIEKKESPKRSRL